MTLLRLSCKSCISVNLNVYNINKLNVKMLTYCLNQLRRKMLSKMHELVNLVFVKPIKLIKY